MVAYKLSGKVGRGLKQGFWLKEVEEKAQSFYSATMKPVKGMCVCLGWGGIAPIPESISLSNSLETDEDPKSFNQIIDNLKLGVSLPFSQGVLVAS